MAQEREQHGQPAAGMREALQAAQRFLMAEHFDEGHWQDGDAMEIVQQINDALSAAPDQHDLQHMERLSDVQCLDLLALIDRLTARRTTPPGLDPVTLEAAGCHGLDNERQVFFYEQDYYVLSNFSAFKLYWRGREFYNSEVAYHFEKFVSTPAQEVRVAILSAPSAHEAFKIAEANKALVRSDWKQVRVGIMRDILRAKADQHEYVKRKLLATGDRELIENSWRDDFWGWGPDRGGTNMLGKLWMEVRADLRALASH